MPRLTAAVEVNGPALRAIRERTINLATGKPWTVSGLAEASGCVKQPYLTQLERESKRTSFAVANQLAFLLGVDVGAIVHRDSMGSAAA